MADGSSSGGGVGFLGLLTIAFVVLRLLGKITWSWWWVISPLWLGAAALVAIVLAGALVAVLAVVIREWLPARRARKKTGGPETP